MNSYEDPAFSAECDLVAERDAHRAQLDEAVRLIKKIGRPSFRYGEVDDFLAKVAGQWGESQE